ncbi:MAG: DMT family transporter [Gammaproteobacteria bacterium]|nr:DMT family transporter [Gammaproteobacteria bacterium]
MSLLANPRLRLFIGAALISLSPVWVRLVDVSSTTSGFYRVLFGSAALVTYLLLTRKRLQLSRNAWIMLLIASVFFALDLWFWHRSINYIGPGLSTLLANFQVFIMMLAGIVLLRQIPTTKQMVAVPLALIGLLLIVGFDWSELPSDYKWGVIFGLLTAVVYAGYLLSLRQSRMGSSYRSPTREVAVVSVVSAVIMAATVVVEGESFIIPTAQDLGWLVSYGVLSHCIGWLFIASSLPEVSTVEAGLALLLQPTLSFVWDVLIFSRPMAALELVGASIALLAIYLGSRPASKQAQGVR